MEYTEAVAEAVAEQYIPYTIQSAISFAAIHGDLEIVQMCFNLLEYNIRSHIPHGIVI